ncbi:MULTISPECIES: YchJ family protein [Streptomyces]|uniref:YchJ family protein n=1 Tax=Streptomyces TaxID=1883 RepID=UPI00210E958D|nr:YchJ family protein [Streptomyces longispororuber]MCQ4212962.1 YchJ family protein [Streptomyces longispororuber]
MPHPTTPTTCACGLPRAYEDCCGRYHSGSAAAPTAEALMRSRYCAFTRRDAGYLLRTWHPDTRPPGIDFDPALSWTGLEIQETTEGSAFHQKGTVTFRARYRDGGRAGALHERSRFVRVAGAWVYVDGDFIE